MSEEELKYFKGLIGFTFDSDDIRYIEKIISNKDKENERLNNIVNDLYNGLEQIIEQGYDYSEKDSIAVKLQDKIKELKGDDKE